MTTPLDEMIEQGKANVRKLTEKAFEGGIEAQFTEEATRTWLLERLEKERQEMFNKLMGLEVSFGELRPNRDGLFAQALRPAMQAQLEKILEEHFPQIIEKVWTEKGKVLREEFKKELRRNFESQLNYEMQSRARKLGEEMAEKVVREMRQELKL
jgi:gamma-glutamyl:cysteine ligase YbdK (ATP-grasp superfamily)